MFEDTLCASAPPWFQKALASPFKSTTATCDGCSIHYLQWCEADSCTGSTSTSTSTSTTADNGTRNTCMADTAPSVVFVHGTLAHAHWFQHIAPQLARDGYDVVALSLSGHGDSGTRTKLGRGVWEKEVITVCAHAGLLAPSRAAKPVLVGHSLGSYVAQETARLYPDDLGGVVVLDGGVPHPLLWTLPPDTEASETMRIESVTRAGTKHAKPGNGTGRMYPNSVRPQTRLRLTPLQDSLPYVHEHIANMSVKPASSPGHWTWKFDPDYHTKFLFEEYVRTVGQYNTIYMTHHRLTCFKIAPTSGFDMCFAIGSQHRWVLGAKYVSNPG